MKFRTTTLLYAYMIFLRGLLGLIPAKAYPESLSISVTTSKWVSPCHGKIILLSEGFKEADDINALGAINLYAPQPIESYLERFAFEGKYEDIVEIPLDIEGTIINHIFVGLGKPARSPNDTCEYLRRSFSSVVPLIKKRKISNLVVQLPEYIERTCNRTYCSILGECGLAALMHDYEYNEHKTMEKNHYSSHITFVIPEGQSFEIADYACKSATIIAKSINKARYWMDKPANEATPTFMAHQAENIAKIHDNLTYKVLEEADAKKLGMGAFLAVSQGSSQPGKIAILEYKVNNPYAKTIAICGKGITYDTGGVSLKSPAAMLGMKYDMCGGACVLSIMDLIAQFKPECNVIGIAPFAENMPDGNAYREDDIVTAMNGKTIEIITTDAEGRLILADALCYVEKEYNPDIIIDIATLTGACLHAVGHFYTAIMSKDYELMELLQLYGDKTGDRMWPLPFHDDYKKANKSNVADIKNKGSDQYLAYCITAGKFLENFVENARWVHCDTAGSSCNVPDVNYLGKGATGASIRAILHVIMNYSSQTRYKEELRSYEEEGIV